MNHSTDTPAAEPGSLRIFGVGTTGINVLDLLIAGGHPAASAVAVNTGGPELELAAAGRKLCLENKRLRGLGSGGDPERGRLAAEEKSEELKALCEGVEVIFIVTGLGGGSGTGISPVLARIAKAAGAFVLAFVTAPFQCEGLHRQTLAEHGLEELRAAADGVICLHNQQIFKLIDENTTVKDTFKIIDRFLADGVHGFCRLVSFRGLIEIHLDDVRRLLQDRQAESSFAVAEAAGPDRSQQVLQKLFAHPMLEEGAALLRAEAVLVSVIGGADLTMAEVNRLMEQVKAKAQSAELMMGASMDESFGDRLAVTVVARQKLCADLSQRSHSEELDTQLLDRATIHKPGSRFLPPAPALPPEDLKKLLALQASGKSRGRKAPSRLRQTQLPLEIISKGRFDKSEPTIHKGEDLDVPTYIRRGVPLN